MVASDRALRRRAPHHWAAILLVLIPFHCHGFVASSLPLSRLGQQLSLSRIHQFHNRQSCLYSFQMSSEVKDEDKITESLERKADDAENMMSKLMQSVRKQGEELLNKTPPFKIEDTSLLYYDIFLIVNLALSISFWVTHRMDISFLPAALSEGSLMSLLWIGAGLINGAFLFSAKDGHYDASDERGGPKAAMLLGFSTFLHAINLRLIVAFIMACLQHRSVGSIPEEGIMPLEIGFGLLLMSVFRFVHSSMVPRI
ncbi:hypothetical protein MPSEU_000228200 [Mayamaea pseudoterrestris]|nr:hypothetical protein MPSEU_000228200 [Mayamaea pseudoterrestris]